MYERLIIVGNLGRDVELRYTPQGTAVANFTMAVSRRYNTADGQQKEETKWFRVSVFGKQAETVNEYLSKGSKVLVEGALVGDETGNPRIWTDKDGKPRASFEIRASTVRFLSKSEKQTEVASDTAQGVENEPVADPF